MVPGLPARLRPDHPPACDFLPGPHLAPGLLPAGDRRRPGYLNPAGEQVIDPEYLSTFGFTDGLAEVVVADGAGTKAALEIDPRNAPAHHNLALVFGSKGDSGMLSGKWTGTVN